MDIRLTICIEEKALAVLDKLAGAIVGNAKPVIKDAPTNKVENISDVDTATTQGVAVEETGTEEPKEVVADVKAIRESVRLQTIKLIKAKKSDAIIALNATYGVERGTEIKDDKVAEYLKALEAL